MNWDGRIQADARHLPLASESVQCVVTSPPYWGLRDYGNSEQLGMEQTPEKYVEALREVFREVWRVLKTDGVLWLPCMYPDGPNSPESISSPHGQGFSRRAKTWAERKAEGEPMRQGLTGPKASGVTSVFTGRPTRNKRSVWTVSTQPYPEAHYATFPEEIPEICIKAGSKPGDLVLDPFFGSGTVGRVAERLSRRWIGIDLGYQDLQAKRVTNVQKEFTCY